MPQFNAVVPGKEGRWLPVDAEAKAVIKARDRESVGYLGPLLPEHGGKQDVRPGIRTDITASAPPTTDKKVLTTRVPVKQGGVKKVG